MLRDLQGIQQEPSDYKLCKECNHLNWYENEECCSCQNVTFSDNKKDVLRAIQEELNFWIYEEHYTEEQADNTSIDV